MQDDKQFPEQNNDTSFGREDVDLDDTADNGVNYSEDENAGFAPYEEEQAANRPKQQVSSFAIASFILAFMSCGCSLFTAIPSIILAFMGYQQINQEPDLYKGKGFLLAGVIISLLILLVGIIRVLLAVAAMTANPDLFDFIPKEFL